MKTLNKIFLALISWGLLFNLTHAAWLDHFNVTLEPENSFVWEALDITIEAMDKNNNIVTDYNWTILIFSESDLEAELPSAFAENTYEFETSDQWVIKFENAIKFKSDWTQNIHVYDLEDESVVWIWEIVINKKEVISNSEIKIISPNEWTIIWKNNIIVSWETDKNHKVKIIVNNKNEFETTSNSEWIFEKNIEELTPWENSIKAQILNANLEVIWESENVIITFEENSLNIKNIKITPEEIDTESSIEVELIANPKLNDVSIVLNDSVTKLKETKDWIYTTKVTAPSTSWIYKIDVILKDELWHEKTELWASSIKVNEIKLNAPEEKEEVIIEEDKELKITWLKVIELKSKSVLSWDEVKWAESYNVYKKLENEELELIENVLEPKFEVEIKWDEIKYDYFAVKAIWKTSSWEIYEWNLSDATKVKTWPELIILLLLSLLIWAIFIFLRQKKA